MGKRKRLEVCYTRDYETPFDLGSLDDPVDILIAYLDVLVVHVRHAAPLHAPNTTDGLIGYQIDSWTTQMSLSPL